MRQRRRPHAYHVVGVLAFRRNLQRSPVPLCRARCAETPLQAEQSGRPGPSRAHRPAVRLSVGAELCTAQALRTDALHARVYTRHAADAPYGCASLERGSCDPHAKRRAEHWLPSAAVAARGTLSTHTGCALAAVRRRRLRRALALRDRAHSDGLGGYAEHTTGALRALLGLSSAH
jgi:hypothetical protein